MSKYDLNNPDDPELERGDALRDEARDRAYTDALEQREERRKAGSTHTGFLICNRGHQAAVPLTLERGDTGTRLFAARGKPVVDDGGITLVISDVVSREAVERAIRTLQDLKP